jgi:hypothetical protein
MVEVEAEAIQLEVQVLIRCDIIQRISISMTANVGKHWNLVLLSKMRLVELDILLDIYLRCK